MGTASSEGGQGTGLKAMPAKKKKGGKKKGGAKKEDDAPPPPPVVFSKRAYEDLELEARVPSFINAALAGDVEVLEEYHAKGFDIESCDCDGRTALMAAAWRGQRAALKTLLAGKCFPDKHDQEGCSGPTDTVIIPLLTECFACYPA